jgi:adenine phosphoribosyltransferase
MTTGEPGPDGGTGLVRAAGSLDPGGPGRAGTPDRGDPHGSDLASRILAGIRDVPDFPQPGIMFKDITPLLADVALFREVVSALGAVDGAVDVVAGIEARGFILAAPVACALGAAFVPIRKQGKLPYRTVAAQYALEYGTAGIEVHADAIRPGQRVLLIDDVLATGGTAAAAADLIEQLGGEVTQITVLMELAFLSGRSRLPERSVRSLVTV